MGDIPPIPPIPKPPKNPLRRLDPNQRPPSNWKNDLDMMRNQRLVQEVELELAAKAKKKANYEAHGSGPPAPLPTPAPPPPPRIPGKVTPPPIAPEPDRWWERWGELIDPGSAKLQSGPGGGPTISGVFVSGAIPKGR